MLELRAAVPDLAAFEERLGWLTKVDSQTWLEAMPAKVVKAADHDAAVREMLKGIPLPSDLHALAGPRRRPHHRPLPGGRRGHQHRLLPLVPAVGRGPQDRRPSGRGRSREGDGDLQAAGRSCARWRRKAPIPKWSGSWRRRCRGRTGNGRAAQVAVAAQGRRPRMRPLGIPLLPWKQKLQRERGLPLPR